MTRRGDVIVTAFPDVGGRGSKWLLNAINALRQELTAQEEAPPCPSNR